MLVELDGRDKKDELTLSIYSGDQVMLWGTSKDYGTCKGIKKNGDKCDMFVNKTECNVCIYHIKKEYIKHCSQRANIGNSRPTAARSLRDKVCSCANYTLIINCIYNLFVFLTGIRQKRGVLWRPKFCVY